MAKNRRSSEDEFNERRQKGIFAIAGFIMLLVSILINGPVITFSFWSLIGVIGLILVGLSFMK